MTGDMGELFNDLRAASKVKRAQNRSFSAAKLSDEDIRFDERNDGAHLIVYASDRKTVDFWPGTGLWKVRGSYTEGRGVFKLITYCKREREHAAKASSQ